VNGYAILSTFTQAAVVVGPALAGGLAALVGPAWVIGADAVSFAVLAVSSTSQNAPSIRIALTSCASSGSRRAPNSCCCARQRPDRSRVMAALLHVLPKTVSRWAKEGKLPSSRPSAGTAATLSTPSASWSTGWPRR
jgi:hypothetical protein